MPQYDASERLRQGDQLLLAGQPAEAREAYLSYIFWLEDKDPQPDAEFYRRLAECHLAVKDYEHARIVYYDRVLELGDTVTAGLAFCGLAKVYLAMAHNRPHKPGRAYNSGHATIEELSRGLKCLLDVTVDPVGQDMSQEEALHVSGMYKSLGGPVPDIIQFLAADPALEL